MDLNLKETELCLGLPGGGELLLKDHENIKKRAFSQTVDLKLNLDDTPSTKINNPPKDNSSNNDSFKPPTK